MCEGKERITMKIKQIMIFFGAMTSSIIFIGCAFDLAHVKYNPAILTECSEDCQTFILREELVLNNLPCGYKRTLKENSEWAMVGSIESGDVYKPLNQCLTIECSNVFEAYLVLNGHNIKGFYFPVEDGYMALKKPIQIIKK
jgi:hypothetical protein